MVKHTLETIKQVTKPIGRGLFTKCYKLDNKTVVLISDCVYKEALACGVDDGAITSRLFPKITKVEDGLYTMKYYPKGKSIKTDLNKLHYSYYKELRRVYGLNLPNEYTGLYEAFKSIKYPTLRNAMIEALDYVSNWGCPYFEISPRNIACYNGRLILLDVFYRKKHANKLRK